MFHLLSSDREGLKIIIVGCGKVGIALVEQLSKEGHDITIIDKDSTIVNNVAGMYDVMGYTGNGASYTTQMEAGIKGADLFIAVTGSDELNLLCCTMAKQVGDCPAIARVRTPDYSKETSYLREKLGLAMIINPELEAAREAARLLYLPTALEIDTFAHGHAEVVKFQLPKNTTIIGQKIADITANSKFDVLFTAIERGKEVFIPSGDFVVEEGDIISFAALRTEAKKFLQEIGYKSHQVKDTMIIGGGKGAYYLAERLISMGIKVKIIESDRRRCEELSLLLPEAIIINGDGIDQELLREEGIEFVESFVPLTGIDEVNILLTLHAKNVSRAKVITKINRLTCNDVINSLELGSVVYPRYITSETIVAYVRARMNSRNSKSIETLYHMHESRVEAIEFVISEENQVVNKPLKELKLRDNVLIGFINHNGKITLPGGNDTMQAGDTVMVVTTHSGFTEIDDILQKE